MATYLHWLDITTLVLLAAAVYFLFVRETETIYVTPRTTFLNRITGGLLLVCWMTSVLLPTLFSPSIAATGRVIGFHQVQDGEGSDHFEFRIGQRQGATTVLRAGYFDKGFYFQDPLVSDGDVIAARWLEWTSEIIEIRVLQGKHVGWDYKKEQRIFFPLLVFLVGVALIVRAIGGAIRASTTRQLDPPRKPKPKSDSILGL